MNPLVSGLMTFRVIEMEFANQAEGTGVEPATPYGAHHFQ